MSLFPFHNGGWGGGVLDDVNSNKVNMLLYLKVNPTTIKVGQVYCLVILQDWPTAHRVVILSTHYSPGWVVDPLCGHSQLG